MQVQSKHNKVAFVTQIWSNANSKTIEQYPSQENGWELVNSKYQPIQHLGLQKPESLIPDQPQMVENSELEDVEDNDFVLSSDDDSGFLDVD